MRWISFEKAGRASYGVVVGNGIVDVGARRPNDRTLKDLLATGDLAKAGADAAKQKADHALADVKYLPVITNPDKILCVGINYKAHQEETGRDPTSHPTIFVRFAAAQIGHEQQMIRPEESDRLDFEGEIALVIGKRGRRIPKRTRSTMWPASAVTTTAACATISVTPPSSLPARTSPAPVGSARG